MRLRYKLINVTIAALAAVLLASCAAFFSASIPSYNIAGIQPEERTNGYIFKIEAAGKIGRVEAWIGPDNWLYMSIPDTNIDAGRLTNLNDCRIVSKMKFFRYHGSVQVTLHLNSKFDHVSVLNYAGDNNVYVVLYKFAE